MTTHMKTEASNGLLKTSEMALRLGITDAELTSLGRRGVVPKTKMGHRTIAYVPEQVERAMTEAIRRRLELTGINVETTRFEDLKEIAQNSGIKPSLLTSPAEHAFICSEIKRKRDAVEQKLAEKLKQAQEKETLVKKERRAKLERDLKRKEYLVKEEMAVHAEKIAKLRAGVEACKKRIKSLA